MIATLLLVGYLIGGAATVRFMLPGQRPLIRIWMGLCLGLLLFMWLPALCSFVLQFTMTAHYVSLLPLAAILLTAFIFRNKQPALKWDDKETKRLKPLVVLLVLFGALSLYLQWTHNLRPADDGSLHVGQSTYGDLAMHVSFITGFVDTPFPPTYNMMKGEMMNYPFLMDSLSSSLYMGGYSLQASLIVPGTLMMLLLYMGFYLTADHFLGGGKAVVWSFLLFFLNGGLGFIYTFDLVGGQIPERIQTILTGFYQTPTNQPTPYNLRWSNLICDLLVPQRTLLAGYTMLMPCLYLLLMGDKKWRTMLMLGLWGGALPMIHTHSFLALGLLTVGILVYELFHAPKWSLLKVLKPYMLYGVCAVLLALPQLIRWTFAQSSSSESFLSFHFNWSNNNGGLVDNYLWFYLKNIGLPVILILMALTEKNPHYRRLASGAFVIFAAAELVRFQPNPYDNNKLLYVWYIIMCLIVADYSRKIWQRLKEMRGKYVLAVFTAVALFLSSSLTVWREVVSDYMAFSSQDVAVAEYVNQNTDRDDTFLTGTQHLNPILVLAGRPIPVSSDSWLYYHGYDTSERNFDVKRFYADPTGNQDVLKKYDIQYIYISSHERSNYVIDEEALLAHYRLLYDIDGYMIFSVKEIQG